MNRLDQESKVCKGRLAISGGFFQISANSCEERLFKAHFTYRRLRNLVGNLI